MVQNGNIDVYQRVYEVSSSHWDTINPNADRMHTFTNTRTYGRTFVIYTPAAYESEIIIIISCTSTFINYLNVITITILLLTTWNLWTHGKPSVGHGWPSSAVFLFSPAHQLSCRQHPRPPSRQPSIRRRPLESNIGITINIYTEHTACKMSILTFRSITSIVFGFKYDL